MNQAINELKQANAVLYAVENDKEAHKLVSEALRIVKWMSDKLT